MSYRNIYYRRYPAMPMQPGFMPMRQPFVYGGNIPVHMQRRIASNRAAARARLDAKKGKADVRAYYRKPYVKKTRTAPSTPSDPLAAELRSAMALIAEERKYEAMVEEQKRMMAPEEPEPKRRKGDEEELLDE